MSEKRKSCIDIKDFRKANIIVVFVELVKLFTESHPQLLCEFIRFVNISMFRLS